MMVYNFLCGKNLEYGMSYVLLAGKIHSVFDFDVFSIELFSVVHLASKRNKRSNFKAADIMEHLIYHLQTKIL